MKVKINKFEFKVSISTIVLFFLWAGQTTITINGSTDNIVFDSEKFKVMFVVFFLVDVVEIAIALIKTLKK